MEEASEDTTGLTNNCTELKCDITEFHNNAKLSVIVLIYTIVYTIVHLFVEKYTAEPYIFTRGSQCENELWTLIQVLHPQISLVRIYLNGRLLKNMHFCVYE